MKLDHVALDPFNELQTFADARPVLRALAETNDGADCPLCAQKVKIYKRKLTSVSARAVRALYATHGCDFGSLPDVAREHLPDVANQGGFLVLGAHWGLIEEERRHRPDGGRTGWWRVTDLGIEWLNGDARLPAYAHIYAGECIGFSGEMVGIASVLEEHFHLGETMRPAGPEAQSELPEAA